MKDFNLLVQSYDNVYENSVREIISQNAPDGIERQLDHQIDLLADMITLLHSKGIISDKEIYDLGRIPECNRFDVNGKRYEVEYDKNSVYHLKMIFIAEGQENRFGKKVDSKIIDTGTRVEMEEKKKALSLV